jgi:hypothetical protein
MFAERRWPTSPTSPTSPWSRQILRFAPSAVKGAVRLQLPARAASAPPRSCSTPSTPRRRGGAVSSEQDEDDPHSVDEESESEISSSFRVHGGDELEPKGEAAEGCTTTTPSTTPSTTPRAAEEGKTTTPRVMALGSTFALEDPAIGGPIVEQMRTAMDRVDVMTRVVDIFREWDDNDSGSVSKDEFARAMRALGCEDVERAQLDELFEMFDSSGDGYISYRELHQTMRAAQPTEELEHGTPAHLVKRNDAYLFARVGGCYHTGFARWLALSGAYQRAGREDSSGTEAGRRLAFNDRRRAPRASQTRPSPPSSSSSRSPRPRPPAGYRRPPHLVGRAISSGLGSPREQS